LNMRIIYARWIPKMWTADQKMDLVRCSEQYVRQFERERV
jgi:hypothetical protein